MRYFATYKYKDGRVETDEIMCNSDKLKGRIALPVMEDENSKYSVDNENPRGKGIGKRYFVLTGKKIKGFLFLKKNVLYYEEE